jgi:predicted SnoaL-like aldol condensation-catalyzing enzyme
VTLVFVQTLADKSRPGSTYTTTAFDMFRIADGKIAEHWDGMRKQ